MEIRNKDNGRIIFEMDDITIIIALCVIAFMVVGHC